MQTLQKSSGRNGKPAIADRTSHQSTTQPITIKDLPESLHPEDGTDRTLAGGCIIYRLAACSPQGWVSKWFSTAVAVYTVHVDDPVVGPNAAVEDDVSRALSVLGFPMDTPETEQSSEL